MCGGRITHVSIVSHLLERITSLINEAISQLLPRIVSDNLAETRQTPGKCTSQKNERARLSTQKYHIYVGGKAIGFEIK